MFFVPGVPSHRSVSRRAWIYTASASCPHKELFGHRTLVAMAGLMPGYMKVNLAVDGILNLFAELHSLEGGNKGNPIGSGGGVRFFLARFPLRRQSSGVTGCAVVLVKRHASLLPLNMDGKQIVDIRYLQALPELLAGSSDEAVHQLDGSWRGCFPWSEIVAKLALARENLRHRQFPSMEISS